MHVVATAGHVDHGKSTLIEALTGMQPDRWAEERRRGLTIDLGFAWTGLPSGATVAFVDVPGHERFVPNMLAGIGPVPAALFVVAADEGWMPQSAEHLAALHALDVRYAVLAVTRCDLADPADAAREARAEIARTCVGAEFETITVSAPTGDGLDPLAAALDRLVALLPAPEHAAPVRLWVDRSFTVKGSGTVVTGTLTAGRVQVGDELELPSLGRTAPVRGLQSLGHAVDDASAVARVALNLRGVSAHEIGRGDTVLTPGAFGLTDLVDARVHGDPAADLPRRLTLHVGSASLPVGIRPLGPDSVRLRLERALPLRLGDRGLLRDPGSHHIAGGVTVLDVAPPRLNRRGAARKRAEVLANLDGRPDVASELRRRGLVRRGDLVRMGVPVTVAPVAGDWLADPDLWKRAGERLLHEVAVWHAAHPLEPGPPVEVVRQALGLPTRELVHALVTAHADATAGSGREDAALTIQDGRVIPADGAVLPRTVSAAVEAIRTDLRAGLFAAPEAARLTELGLGAAELAAAERAGALVRLAPGVVLLPEAVPAAAEALAALPQPFTVSQARTALGTTRRVAVPLLEHLDRMGHTRREPDDRRTASATPR